MREVSLQPEIDRKRNEMREKKVSSIDKSREQKKQEEKWKDRAT